MILVDPRTGQHFDGPDENAAEAQKQFGLVTPEAYAQQQSASQLQAEHGGAAEQIGTAFDQGLRSAAAPLGGIAAPEDVDAAGNPTALSPVPSSPDVLARAAANPNAALVGKLIGSAPAYGALGAAAAATGGAAAAGLGASSAIGAAAGLATESAATGTLQAAQEGDLSAWNVAKNGLVNFALGAILPVAGALHRAAFGGSALEQAVQSTIQRAGAAGENLSDPVIADAYRSRVQGKIDDTVSKIGEAVDSARPPVASNRQAQSDALEQLGESLRNDSPLVADAIDSARALPRDQRYKALLELANETEAPETQQALGDVIQDRSLWGDAAVDHGIAVQAAKDARYSDPSALANAARGIKDDGVQRLVLDLDSHLQDSARIDAAQAFGVAPNEQGSTVGAAHADYDATLAGKAINQIKNGSAGDIKVLASEAPAQFALASRVAANDFDAIGEAATDEFGMRNKHAEFESAADQWSPAHVAEEQNPWFETRIQQLKEASDRLAQLPGTAGHEGIDIINRGIRDLEELKGSTAEKGKLVDFYGDAAEDQSHLAEAQQVADTAGVGKSIKDFNALPLEPGDTGVESLKGYEHFQKNGNVEDNFGSSVGGLPQFTYEDGQLFMNNGRHRWTAAEELGRDSIIGHIKAADDSWSYMGPIRIKPWEEPVSGVAANPGKRMQRADFLKQSLDRLVMKMSRSRATDLGAPEAVIRAVRPAADSLREGLQDATLFGKAGALQKDVNAAMAEDSAIAAWSRVQNTATEVTGREYGVVGVSGIERRAKPEALQSIMSVPGGPGENFSKDLGLSIDMWERVAEAYKSHGQTPPADVEQFLKSTQSLRDQFNYASVLRIAEKKAGHEGAAHAGMNPGAVAGLVAGHFAEAAQRAATGIPLGRAPAQALSHAGGALYAKIRAGLGLPAPQLVEDAASPLGKLVGNAHQKFKSLEQLGGEDFSEHLMNAPSTVAQLLKSGASKSGALAAGAVGIGALTLGGTADAAENPDQAHAAYLAKDSQEDTVATARAMSDPAYAAEYARRTAGNPSTLEQFQGEHETLQQAFIEKRDAVQRMLRDPDAVIDALGGSLGGLAPGLRDDLGAHAMKVATFLQAELPPQRGVSVTRPNGLPPSSLEARTYALKYQTALDPSTAFDDAKRGMLRHEQVDTLKVCSPELYDDLRAETLNAMANGQSSIVQRQRADLLFDFGSALDPAFSPALSAAASQARLAKANAAPSPGSAPDKTSIPGNLAPDGIQSLTATGARAP